MTWWIARSCHSDKRSSTRFHHPQILSLCIKRLKKTKINAGHGLHVSLRHTHKKQPTNTHTARKTECINKLDPQKRIFRWRGSILDALKIIMSVLGWRLKARGEIADSEWISNKKVKVLWCQSRHRKQICSNRFIGLMVDTVKCCLKNTSVIGPPPGVISFFGYQAECGIERLNIYPDGEREIYKVLGWSISPLFFCTPKKLNLFTHSVNPSFECIHTTSSSSSERWIFFSLRRRIERNVHEPK